MGYEYEEIEYFYYIIDFLVYVSLCLFFLYVVDRLLMF